MRRGARGAGRGDDGMKWTMDRVSTGMMRGSIAKDDAKDIRGGDTTAEISGAHTISISAILSSRGIGALSSVSAFAVPALARARFAHIMSLLSIFRKIICAR